MTATQILFVDDDANILAGYKRTLQKRFQVVTSLSGDEGLARLAKDGPFAVVVADMQMPGMNGIEFLRKAQKQTPETVRLMLTGNADQKTAVDAVNEGHVFSFLSKPCPAEALETALNNALQQHRLIIAEKELLERTLNGAIKVLTDVLAMTDPEAFGRAQRLRDEMKAVASWFGAPRSWELEVAAMLSQIGFVAIPGNVLVKSRARLQLTGPEKDMLARVPQTGASLLENIPRLSAVADIVRYQQKNFDGTGFPGDNVAGEDIPIGARILRVLNDLLDAEVSMRSRAKAFQEIRRKSGFYDPKVLEAVAACFDIFLEAPEAAEPQAVRMRLADVTVGDVIAEDLLMNDGALLVPANAKITPPLLQKLRNFAKLSVVSDSFLIRRG